MKIQVIVGSIREGRHTDRLAKWVMSELKDHEGVKAELVDLRDYEMPFFNEAISPNTIPTVCQLRQLLSGCTNWQKLTDTY